MVECSHSCSFAGVEMESPHSKDASPALVFGGEGGATEAKRFLVDSARSQLDFLKIVRTRIHNLPADSPFKETKYRPGSTWVSTRFTPR